MISWMKSQRHAPKVPLVILAALAVFYPLVSQAKDGLADGRVTAWYVANELCIGAYDQKDRDVACAFRDLVGIRLDDAGFCYGKKSDPGNKPIWHPCGPNSRR